MVVWTKQTVKWWHFTFMIFHSIVAQEETNSESLYYHIAWSWPANHFCVRKSENDSFCSTRTKITFLSRPVFFPNDREYRWIILFFPITFKYIRVNVSCRYDCFHQEIQIITSILQGMRYRCGQLSLIKHINRIWDAF